MVKEKSIITVFGLGFVGLTTALGFAHYGNEVYGADVDCERKGILRQGRLPFMEKGIDIALNENLNKNFVIIDDVREAVQKSDFIFFCVGTPYTNTGEADLKYLMKAVEEALKHIDKDRKTVLVIKSTVPPSTTRDKVKPFIEEEGFVLGQDLFLVNNPEFLREGYCWDDFINSDRIVIGNDNGEALLKLINLYKPFNAPVISVSFNTGEFIKYLSNTLLASMISFSNEMSVIADAIGSIDIAKAFSVLHMDRRWHNGQMSSYVYPGCGYGGYCLPKDTKALYSIAEKHGAKPEILYNVIDLNDNMPDIIFKRMEKNITKVSRIGILGLSFKPNSNDVRDSVSAKIIKILLRNGFNNIIAYDPIAVEEFKHIYNFHIEYAYKLESVCNAADVLIILTAWDEFHNVKKTTDKPVLDFRYME